MCSCNFLRVWIDPSSLISHISRLRGYAFSDKNSGFQQIAAVTGDSLPECGNVIRTTARITPLLRFQEAIFAT